MVSIIIPVFNTGFKLEKCLDSVLNQDYNDFECIIVDDGSNDNSGEIADKYGQLDNRFVVVHKSNGGVSSARNLGIRIAKGEWLVFVDSDDVLLPEHLSCMVDATCVDVDIVMTGFRFLHPSEITEHKYTAGKYIGVKAISNFILQSDFLDYQIPWDRMYRNKRSKRDELEFDEKLSLSEDRLFCYNYLIHCKGIATVEKITYIHDGTDVGSLSYRKYPSSMNKHRYRVFKTVISELEKIYVFDALEYNKLSEYLINIYTDLINSYRLEKKIIAYYRTRLLNKLRLL